MRFDNRKTDDVYRKTKRDTFISSNKKKYPNILINVLKIIVAIVLIRMAIHIIFTVL